MSRALAVGPRPRLEATISFHCVVQVLGGPWCVHALDLDIMAVEELPRGTGGAARRLADLVPEDDGVGIVDKGDIIAKIVTGKILGSEKSQSVWSP